MLKDNTLRYHFSFFVVCELCIGVFLSDAQRVKVSLEIVSVYPFHHVAVGLLSKLTFCEDLVQGLALKLGEVFVNHGAESDTAHDVISHIETFFAHHDRSILGLRVFLCGTRIVTLKLLFDRALKASFLIVLELICLDEAWRPSVFYVETAFSTRGLF